MAFYDTHMHSCLSFDSTEQPENYIDDSKGTLIFTDHLDVYNPINDHEDDIPDFDQLFSWKDSFLKEHKLELLAGVEVGYLRDRHDQISKIISSHDFDLVLVSNHQNGRYDYMDQPDEDTPEEMMMDYVDGLLEAIHYFDQGQIMTHFDYGFRIYDMTLDQLGPYKDKLRQVFELIIEKDMAFELNSKSIIKYDKLDLYQWAIPEYQKLGGKLFSLGSDAHYAKDLFLDFDQLIALLEDYGVKDICQFRGQKLELMGLEEVNNQLGI